LLANLLEESEEKEKKDEGEIEMETPRKSQQEAKSNEGIFNSRFI